MSMAEPFLPRSRRDETIAAADAGVGAPEPAPGFGIDGEHTDVPEDADDASGSATPPDDVPFRTPDPDDVGRGS